MGSLIFKEICFGPILADRVADFQKKDDFLNVLSSLCFIESPKRKFIAQGYFTHICSHK